MFRPFGGQEPHKQDREHPERPEDTCRQYRLDGPISHGSR